MSPSDILENESTHLLSSNESKTIKCSCKSMKSFKNWLIKYFFFISLLIVMLFSVFYPDLGHNDGPLYPKITSSYIAVMLILFLSGISIHTKELKKSTLYWRLNMFTQFNIYIWWPLTGYLLSLILLNIPNVSIFNDNLMKGLLILCCVPTSTASCVVFTQSANGNESAAVVNTTIANLMGVVITPMLVFIYIGNLGSLSIEDLLLKLTLRVILPFICGQFIRFLGGNTLEKWLTLKYVKFSLKKLKEFAILFLIFCALSETFYNGFNATLIDVIVATIVIICMHILNAVIIWMFSGILKAYNIYDRIAILFCSIQKTAAVGIPIIETIYEDDTNLGLFILPVILYQPIQAFAASLLVYPLANKVEKFEQQKLIEVDISMQSIKQ